MRLALGLLCVFAAIGVSGASAADFDADHGSCPEPPGGGAVLRCPTGYVGAPYQVQIESEEGSGCTPFVWYEVVNSSLPAGLSMSRSGLISGVPTGAGVSRFWLWNHDLTAAQGGPVWCVFDDRSEREFSIPIDPGLAISNASVVPATVGVPYTEALTTKQVVSLNPPTGPDVQASWSVQSGTLPPGITLSTSGALTGTPTTEGSYQFVVKAQNGSPFDTKAYTLSVRQPVTVKSPFAAAQRPGAEVGIRFGRTLRASGGSGAYTWSLASGALPTGVALTNTGSISGTPEAAGNFRFAVTATDAEGRAATADGSLTVAPKLTIKTLRLKTARRGRAYRSQLATVGGVAPLRWKLSGKLPRGVRFAKSVGALVGTPRRNGAFRVRVEARDTLGARAQTTLVLLVKT